MNGLAGAAVMLADFKEDAVRTAAEELVATGHKALAVRCDVSDDAQVAAMIDRTLAAFGRLDCAFNNAGVMAKIAATAESTREDWDRVIGVNLRGVWSCMKHELKQMERQGSGPSSTTRRSGTASADRSIVAANPQGPDQTDRGSCLTGAEGEPKLARRRDLKPPRISIMHGTRRLLVAVSFFAAGAVRADDPPKKAEPERLKL